MIAITQVMGKVHVSVPLHHVCTLYCAIHPSEPVCSDPHTRAFKMCMLLNHSIITYIFAVYFQKQMSLRYIVIVTDTIMGTHVMIFLLLQVFFYMIINDLYVAV